MLSVGSDHFTVDSIDTVRVTGRPEAICMGLTWIAGLGVPYIVGRPETSWDSHNDHNGVSLIIMIGCPMTCMGVNGTLMKIPYI